MPSARRHSEDFSYNSVLPHPNLGAAARRRPWQPDRAQRESVLEAKTGLEILVNAGFAPRPVEDLAQADPYALSWNGGLCWFGTFLSGASWNHFRHSSRSLSQKLVEGALVFYVFGA